MQRRRAFTAFTLVELLVVIGIIALLVAILLPALGAARRQAQTVKCAAALREIGNAVAMYVADNNGWAPPAKLLGSSAYDIPFPYLTPPIDVYYGASLAAGSTTNPPSVTPGSAAYWFNMLSKYVTRNQVSVVGTNSAGLVAAQSSVFWGCPAYVPLDQALNQTNLVAVQTGYGFNAYPAYTATYPAAGVDFENGASANGILEIATPGSDDGWRTVVPNAGSGYGPWYKFNAYTHPADRALVGDAVVWLMQADGATTGPRGSTPAIPGQLTFNNTAIASGPLTSTMDWYRHGTYPRLTASAQFSPFGGKIFYNMLFCDGHVATQNTREATFKAIRQRFPG